MQLAVALACALLCLAARGGAPASAATKDGSSLKAARAHRPRKKALPTIAGVLEDGQVLTASDGTWNGTTPLSFSYQWEECRKKRCAAIAGATESSYRLTTSEIGRKLSVLVTASNSAGKAVAKAKPTDAIAPGPPVNMAPPTVSGTPLPGQTLSTSTGAWVGTPTLAYSYQWRACNIFDTCANIEGATEPTYTVEPLQVAESLEVVVTATNSVGSSSVTSEATSLVGALLPSDVTLPGITGALAEGGLLSASSGTWSATAPIAYEYEWELCNAAGEACKGISGALEPTLSLVTADIGSTLRAVVTATNKAGSTSVTSPATSVVKALLPSNNGLPGITGTLAEGGLLSASSGSWSGTAPIAYEYEWELCNAAGEACKGISGALEPTLSLLTADIGSTLRVIVTATNAAGSTSATSPSTSVVKALLPSDVTLPGITGTLAEGGLLSALSGTWSGTVPIAYEYAWELCNAAGEACKGISGALEPTLSLLTGDIGSTLRVIVTATNAAGSTSATSPATSVVKALLPSNVTLPGIKGSLVEGQLLSASAGSWSGTAPIAYEYAWELCNAAGEACKGISGALEPTLSLVTADIGSTLRAVVTATNSAGSTSATSPATSVVKGLLPSNVKLPTISGLLQVGQLLNAASGSWSGTLPITYGYQWETCNLSGEGCKDISEATKDVLTLSLGDLGLKLRVVVTATNEAGSTAATSAATGLIESLL